MNIDILNIILILFSCLIAHFIPFELLLFSYAFLGPAHYLTEISWLHDNDYFLDRKLLIVPFVTAAILLLLFPKYYFLVIIAIMCFAVSVVSFKTWHIRLLVMFLATIFLFLATYYLNLEMLWLLVPTLIHVFVFTALFMWYGALKSASLYGKMSVVVLFLAALSFLLPVSSEPLFMDYVDGNIHHLEGIYNMIVSTFDFQLDETVAKFAGFSAFAYTYHYLNWFSKTRIIEWHKISKKRAGGIVVLYSIAIGLYSYDYGIGFAVLLALSLGHVVLEFPLNARTFGALVPRFLLPRS